MVTRTGGIGAYWGWNMNIVHSFYVYTNSRKTDGSIFYVGKGKGRRAYISDSRNRHWRNVSAKHGFVASIISDGHTEAEAFEIEKTLIAKLRSEGARLVNRTNGGDGVTGYRFTEVQKSRAKPLQLAGLRKESVRQKISLSVSALHQDKDFLARKSAAMKECNSRAEVKAKMSVSVTKALSDPAVRKNISAKVLSCWENPEYREKQRLAKLGKKSPKLSAYWARRREEKQAAAACLLANLGPSAAATGRTGD